MTWDGAPDGWRPPAEERAAAEAAEKFEAERAAADARTQALADAIAFGLDRVALAIVAAAGDDARRRYHHMLDAGFDDPADDVPVTADFMEPRREPVDPDLADLLNDDTDDTP